MGVGPRHHHLARLQRRAEAVERLGTEFRQFVEEQHPVVRQRHLARLGLDPAAGQGGHAGGVMGRPEWPGAGQLAARDQPGHRMDHRGLQQLGGRQRRQDAGQALGHHRLARPWRTGKQQVVTAGGGDLQRPLGLLLALHLAQVRDPAALNHPTGLRLRQELTAPEVVDQADQRARRQHPRAAGPGRLGAARLGADQTQVHGPGRHRRRQHARHRRHRPVQRQFSHRGPAVQGVGRDHAHGRQDRQPDRQIVVAALLGQVGRRKIDDHPLGRHRKAQAGESPANALATLGHRLVAEADHHQGALAAGELNLDIDPARLHALKGHRHHARDHARPRYRSCDLSTDSTIASGLDQERIEN